MSEKESFTFIDLAKYLQNELDKKYKKEYVVANEKNGDIVFNGTTKVVVRALSSNTFNSSAELNYQLDILTDDIEREMNRFTKLVSEYNNTIIESIVPTANDEVIKYKIFQRYTTPTVMQLDITNLGIKHCSRLVIFATLVAMKDVNDIIALEVNGELLVTLDRSLNYVTELVSYPIQNKTLVSNEVRTSSVSISFTMINQSNCLFTKQLSAIRQGKLPINKEFEVKLYFTDGTNELYNAKVQQVSVSSANAKLPSTSVILIAQIKK